MNRFVQLSVPCIFKKPDMRIEKREIKQSGKLIKYLQDLALLSLISNFSQIVQGNYDITGSAFPFRHTDTSHFTCQYNFSNYIAEIIKTHYKIKIFYNVFFIGITIILLSLYSICFIYFIRGPPLFLSSNLYKNTLKIK